MLSPNSRKTLIHTKAARIYEILKLDICNGDLKPCDRLIISKEAQKYDVSEIPVREAFNRLRAEGFLRIDPHRGIYVTEIDTEYMEKLYPIRCALEGYATRAAASVLTLKDFKRLSQLIQKMEKAVESGQYAKMGKLNYDFHMTIYKASGNEPLLEKIEELWWKTNRIRAYSELRDTIATRSISEHKDILAALKEGQKRKAERLVVAQKQRSLKLLIKYMNKMAGQKPRSRKSKTVSV